MSRAIWPAAFVPFVDLPDPLQHSLPELVVMAIAAPVAGADSWSAIALWAQTKEPWLRTFLPLPQGIPSHDAIGRVFTLLDPQQIAICYQAWMPALVPDALRTCRVIEDAATRAWLQDSEAGAWAGLRTIVQDEMACQRGDRMQQETRYYLRSLAPDAARRQEVIRRHWAIGTELHWVLDVVFAEDQSRIRVGYAAPHAGTLRKLALSVLKQAPTPTLSLRGTRQRAGGDDPFLAQVLGVPAPPPTIP